MNRTIFARLGVASATLLSCALALSAPAGAADDGGAGPNDGGATFGTPTAAAPATGDGGTLLVKTAVLLNRTLTVQGTMAHGLAGRQVSIERQQKDGTWVQTAIATTTGGGYFTATWKANHIGRFPIRAVPFPTAGASAAAVPATGVTPVTVYRQAVATYFGPGFFGQKTACGQVLRRSTLGVAHRTLPCGTMVALYYKGRTITVPVIDRGPFREDTSWDLTTATADALKFTSTGKVGALRLSKADAAAAATAAG